MDTDEEVAVPCPVVFEEVHGDDDQKREDHVNIAFRHSADGGSNGVVFALSDGRGQDINVVVEEGGSSGANGDHHGHPGSGYTMIRHEEVKVLRQELEQAKKTVEMQITELNKAKEMILEQGHRIAELEEDKKKHEIRRDGGENSGKRKKEDGYSSSLNGRIEDLEKTVEHLKKVVKDKKEELHQKELILLQKDADHDTVKAMNISEVATLKKLLGDEREKRVIAEMQVKMLLGSIDPVKYMASRETETLENRTGKDVPITPRTPPPAPVSTSSKRENLTAAEDEDDEVLFIEEVEKEANDEVADADSGYPRYDSENESEKVDDLMAQKYVCKACGLVCSTTLSLMRHIRFTHGQPESQLQNNSQVISEPVEIGTPISGPSTSTYPHNLRKRTPCTNAPINDIRRSSSSSAASSLSGYWRNDKKGNFKGTGKFICTLCEERFPIVSKLKLHKKQAHGIEDNKFSIGCKDCGIVFNERKEHTFHRRTVHGTQYNGRRSNTPHPITGSSGPTLPKINDEEAHALPPEAGTPIQAMKKHEIDIKRFVQGCFCTCGLEFRTTSHIKIHIQRNKNDSFPQIPTPAQNAVNLATPEAGTEEEEFESKMVIDENGMRILTIQRPPPPSPPPLFQQRHQLVGVDPKVHRAKYPCTCGMTYYNRASFQIHAKSKNNGKIFKCGWCTMSFDLHGNLKSHVRTYHKAIYGNGKFACGNCAQTFDNSRQLGRHRRQECMNYK